MERRPDINTRMYRFGDIAVDAAQFAVQRRGEWLELEPKAIRVLLYLLDNHERVVPKDELIEKVWDGVEVTDNALTRVVGQLRKALGDEAKNSRYIETIPTIGYRFIGELQAAEPATQPKVERKWRWSWALAVGLALAALLFASLPKRKAKEVAELTNFRQITNSRTLDTGPALSPDGKWLAYSSDRSGQFEIYLRPLEGQGKEIQITNDGGPNVEAAWSPDGKWIAFHCVARAGICMIPATGGSVRVLASPGSQPSWSPDSKKLVYRAANLISLSPLDLFAVLPHGLVVLDIDSGERKEYKDLNSNRNLPAWSADGKWILYSALPFLAYARIEALRLSDGATHEVFRVDGLTAGMRLSPDNRRLYFSRFHKPAAYGLAWVDLDPNTMQVVGEQHEVTRTPSFPMNLEISRDGRKMIVAGVEQDSNIYRLPLRPGAEAIPLTNNRNFRNTAPTVSPDGSKIAFAVRQLGHPQQIWIMDSDGGNPEMISAEEINSIFPAWNKDGTAILYRVPPKGMEEVKLADRTRRQWKLPGRSTNQARGTRRGRELIFHELNLDQLRIGLLDLESGAMNFIPLPTRDIAYGSLSPTGERIAAERMESSYTHLVVFPLSGKGLRQFTNGKEHVFTGDWSADGKWIAFAGMRNGSWNIYATNPDTAEEKKLTNYRSLRTFVRYPVWSPKNDWVLFEKTENSGNLYLLDLVAN